MMYDKEQLKGDILYIIYRLGDPNVAFGSLKWLYAYKDKIISASKLLYEQEDLILEYKGRPVDISNVTTTSDVGLHIMKLVLEIEESDRKYRRSRPPAFL